MKKMVVILMILSSGCTLFSQTFSVFDVDTSNFPYIKAKYYVNGQDGKQINNLTVSDFEVKENGQLRTVTNVSCPPGLPPKALSSVLTLDISGSMTGRRLQIVKTAATHWVNNLLLGKSECALTTFDDKNYINQDFTNNLEKLMNSINSLQARGGTDYNEGLINPMAGSLQISQNGKYNKVIVFLTDGMPNHEPQVSNIIAEAIAQNCVIYVVVVGLTCPQSLIDISTQTGGLWFDNINTEEETQSVFREILKTAQGSNPCEIAWQSDVSCFAGNTNVELQIPSLGLTANTSYKILSTAEAKLDFNPPSVKFAYPKPGEFATPQTVTVTARNVDFSVTNIVPSVVVGFGISPTSFSLKAGESIVLTVTYFPADSGYNYCSFDMESLPCPTKLFVSGGWKGKKPAFRTIKLVHPNSGEVFVAGSDTVITWEGVSPDESVLITYSTNNGGSWDTIATKATGWSYKWRVPETPSNQCLASVIATAKNTGTSYIDMVRIPAGSFQMGNTGAHPGLSNELPVHTVTISRDFMMSKYEITQKHYEEIIGTNPSNFKGKNLPVETVTWYDAVAFCNKLSDIEGRDRCYSGSGTSIVCDWSADGYRLPTEAEWEYACKAGTTTDLYSGILKHDQCSPLDSNLHRIGWYCGNESLKTREVGQKEPNSFGLYDMSGNVWEWCWDWLGSYSAIAETDPIGTSSGSLRIIRGGSWLNFANRSRSSFRYNDYPSSRYYYLGFRVVSLK